MVITVLAYDWMTNITLWKIVSLASTIGRTSFVQEL